MASTSGGTSAGCVGGKLSQPCFFNTSIGKKVLMGATGLGLSLFVLMHMLGNLALFVSAEAYNKYSHALVSNPVIYLAEAGLLGIFVFHLISGIRLTLQNKKARGSRYAMWTQGEKAVSHASRTMIHTGILVFIFAVYHLITFKFGPHYDVTYDGVTMRDLHRLVVEVFQSPAYVFGYIIALLALGHHLSHGVKSAFQSLGLNHPKYNCLISSIGWGFALLVTLGFISQPLYVYFFLNR